MSSNSCPPSPLFHFPLSFPCLMPLGVLFWCKDVGFSLQRTFQSFHLRVFSRWGGAGLLSGEVVIGVERYCGGQNAAFPPCTRAVQFQTLLGRGAHDRVNHCAVFTSTDDWKPGYYSISGNPRILLTCSLWGGPQSLQMAASSHLF